MTEEIRKFLQQGAADQFLNKQAYCLVSAESSNFCGSYYNPTWNRKFRAEHMQQTDVVIQDFCYCFFIFILYYFVLFHFILF